MSISTTRSQARCLGLPATFTPFPETSNLHLVAYPSPVQTLCSTAPQEVSSTLSLICQEQSLASERVSHGAHPGPEVQHLTHLQPFSFSAHFFPDNNNQSTMTPINNTMTDCPTDPRPSKRLKLEFEPKLSTSSHLTICKGMHPTPTPLSSRLFSPPSRPLSSPMPHSQHVTPARSNAE